MRSFGPNGVFLKTEKSRLLIPSPRTLGRVLATLPNVNAGGSVNWDVSNHLFSRCCAAPLISALVPVLLGRSEDPTPARLPVRLAAVVRKRGVPFCAV